MSFEPGHAALTAAMAASSAESAAAADADAAAAAAAATGPATASLLDNPSQNHHPSAQASAAATDAGTDKNKRPKQGGKATPPATPADGVWSASGGDGGGNNERSTERVASGDGATAQVSPGFCVMAVGGEAATWAKLLKRLLGARLFFSLSGGVGWIRRCDDLTYLLLYPSSLPPSLPDFVSLLPTFSFCAPSAARRHPPLCPMHSSRAIVHS